MRKIEWKEYKYSGFSYLVSDTGLVRSLSTNKLIKQRINADGYKTVTLGKFKRTSKRVHRLVAEVFIPNPNNLPEVNHIDLDRQNNRVNNLEWVTHQDNIQHSVELGSYNGDKFLGALNPNYKNTTLKEKYKNNPELAHKNSSRPREQNGMCKPVTLHNIYTFSEHSFNFIGECAEFLIEHGYSKTKNVNCVRDRITLCYKENKVLYKNFMVVF